MREPAWHTLVNSTASTPVMSIRLNVPIIPENATYTACWCEENIYLLGKSFLDDLSGFRDEWKAYVAFMSNESKTVCRVDHREDASS